MEQRSSQVILKCLALALVALAPAYADQPRRQSATSADLREETLGRAVDAAMAAAWTPTKANKLTEVAERYAEAGQFARALELVDSITLPGFKCRAMVKVAAAYAQASQADKAAELLDQARVAASRIGDPFSNGWVKIVRTTEKRTFRMLDWLEQRLTRKDADMVTRDEVLYEYGSQLRDYYDSKAFALACVADGYANLNESAKALETLQQAHRLAIAAQDAAYRSWILTEIACGFCTVGEYEQADRIARSIEEASYTDNITRVFAQAGEYKRAFELADTLEEGSCKAMVLLSIAGVCAEHGKSELLFDSLQEALENATLAKDDYLAAKALIRTAQAFIRQGREESAFELLREASESTKSIEDPFEKGLASNWIAVGYAELRQYDEAVRVIDTIDGIQFKVSALCAVALRYSKEGRKDEASGLFSRALEVAANEATDTSTRDRTFRSISSWFAQASRFDEALQTAAKIGGAEQKAGALVRIAEACGRAGEKPKARQLLAECMVLAQAIEAPVSRSSTFLEIDKCLQKLETSTECDSAALPGSDTALPAAERNGGER